MSFGTQKNKETLKEGIKALSHSKDLRKTTSELGVKAANSVILRLIYGDYASQL